MFCTKCGEQIPDDGKFCPKCGTSVVEDEIPVTPPSGKEKKPSDVNHPPKKKKKETVHSRDFWKRYCIKTTLTERIRELRQTRERRELMA